MTFIAHKLYLNKADLAKDTRNVVKKKKAQNFNIEYFADN